MGMNEELQGVSVWTRTRPLPGHRTDKGIRYDALVETLFHTAEL